MTAAFEELMSTAAKLTARASRVVEKDVAVQGATFNPADPNDTGLVLVPAADGTDRMVEVPKAAAVRHVLQQHKQGGYSGAVGNKAGGDGQSQLVALKDINFDPASQEFGNPGAISAAQLWSEIAKTNVFRNAASPKLDFHDLLIGQAGFIAFGPDQELVNAPGNVASGLTGFVIATDTPALGTLNCLVTNGSVGAIGTWSKTVKNGVWSDWTTFNVDQWFDVIFNDFQASPGYRLRVADNVTVKLMTSAQRSIVAVRMVPLTTWDKVPQPITTQQGWTVQTKPASGAQEVLWLPFPLKPDWSEGVWQCKAVTVPAASAAQAQEVTPQSQNMQPAAPIPSVAQPVWQVTNANVSPYGLITYFATGVISSVTFSYTDPEDDAVTGVFSLNDLTTGFSASGYYGGDTRFIDVTMSNGKAVKVILSKRPNNGLAIVVAKPGANLSVFGKIANVQLTVAAPVVPVTEASKKCQVSPDASTPEILQAAMEAVQTATEITLGALSFRIGGPAHTALDVQVRSATAQAQTAAFHGWEARNAPSSATPQTGGNALAINGNTGAWVDLGNQDLDSQSLIYREIWTDTHAYTVRAYRNSLSVFLHVKMRVS